MLSSTSAAVPCDPTRRVRNGGELELFDSTDERFRRHARCDHSGERCKCRLNADAGGRLPDLDLTCARADDQPSVSHERTALGVRVGKCPALGRGQLRERGHLGIVADDHAIPGPLVTHDLLLRGAIRGEAAVELEMVGPERGDHGDLRAVRHEGEVRARELDDVSTVLRLERGERFVGRPEVPGAGVGACDDGDTGGAKQLDDERARRRLARRPGDANGGNGRALEEQVAEAAQSGTGRAQARDARRNLGCPDVEVGDIRGADVAFVVEIRELKSMPFCCEEPRECKGVGRESLDEDVHQGIVPDRDVPSPRFARVAAYSSIAVGEVPKLVMPPPTIQE